MQQAARPSIDPRTARSRASGQTYQAWSRLCLALAVMLLAVMPHVTLAATMGVSGAPPALAAPAAHHGSARHDDAAAHSPAPCHETCDPAHPSAMPSCCILGCGLLSVFDVGTLAIVRTRWQSLAPAPAQSGEDRIPEPAERPPRQLARTA